MFCSINSMSLSGLEGKLIRVEVDVSNGLPDFSLVGDLSSEVKEARERVRTAIRNSGFSIPGKRVTVNLAPANLRKEGSAFDIAIAVGILVAYEILPPESVTDTVLLGELGLDGKICRVPGILPMVLAAKQAGFLRCIVPAKNVREAAVVEGIDVLGVSSLLHLTELLLTGEIPECPRPEPIRVQTDYDVDFSEVNGQRGMRRAAEVAACGMHNLLLLGSPGSGKTMIARRLPTILPALTGSESLEVSRVYSVCDLLPPDTSLLQIRPFRSPHHTVSAAALVGGGSRPRPGEISLASHGVLFLDELPEYSAQALEALRQPLEDRKVTVSRVWGSYEFPADVMLCAAMNPCRCGFYPDRSRCHCSEGDVHNYLRRISRPLLDRIDVCVEAPPMGYEEIGGAWENESSATIRARVEAAWEIQQARFSGSGIHFNSRMNSRDVKQYCTLGESEEKLMRRIYTEMGLSARAYHRVLKVARTIADMDQSEMIKEQHLLEALGYRSLDRRFWG